MSSRPTPRTIATSLAALLVPLSIAAASITGAYYKSNNPNNVDITNGLAYLQQTLIAGFGVGIIIGLCVVGLIIHMYRQDKNFIQAKFPLLLLVAVGVIIGTAGLFSGYTSRVEDQYRIDRGQPTLQQFFDKLESNNK